MRILAAYGVGKAAQSLSDVAACDVIWLSNDTPIDDALAQQIIAEVNRRQCGLVCEIPFVDIDSYFATFADLPNVQFLCQANHLGRYAALSAALMRKPIQLNDIVQEDAALERIERLREEVTRIGMMLSRLTAGPDTYQTIEGQAQSNYGSARALVGESMGEMLQSPSRSYRGRATPTGEPNIAGPAAPIYRMIRQRRLREQFLPHELFSDPAWDMLLDLYAARLEKRRVSVSSLCIAAAVPSTTALRWIKNMTDAGIFERQDDPMDGRRIFVTLSNKTAEAMKKYCSAIDKMY